MQMLESHFQGLGFGRLGGVLRDLHHQQVPRDEGEVAAPGAPVQTRCLRMLLVLCPGLNSVPASESAGC